MEQHTHENADANGLDCVIFDLDGVVTFTAHVHEAAWKEMFDEYLRVRSARLGEPFRAFDSSDYRQYVDGRSRHDGIRTFLHARGIELPPGQPLDSPGEETEWGLGNWKDEVFRAHIREDGVDVDPEAIRLIRELGDALVAVGLASSSRNAELVLDRAGISDHFDAVVDGVRSEALGLAAKPAPDIFLQCLADLGRKDTGRAAVVEDAISGIEAGRVGGFGLVLAVDRGGNRACLEEHGADVVVSDFTGVTVADLKRWFSKARD